MNNNYALIMAGGVGTRLWPISRQQFPKQFHDVLGTGESLLQLTFNRLKAICPIENIYIISNQQYDGLIKEQLPELINDQILLEPALRNTAPCVAYAFHKIAQKNPNANLIVSPADHLIIKQEEFTRLARRALEITAQEDRLVTFGIEPTRPDTGYGYIEFDRREAQDAYKVKAFREKPDQATAEAFLKEGNFVWNSGIFVWSLAAIRRSYEQHLPEVDRLFAKGKNHYYSDQESQFIEEVYSNCMNISIDYGILEKAENVYVMPADIGWTDLGTWKSIDGEQAKDNAQNSIQGTVMTYDTRNCFIKIPRDKIGVVQGLDNYIVVMTDDALMICSKDQEQMVKQFLNDIKKKELNQYV